MIKSQRIQLLKESQELAKKVADSLERTMKVCDCCKMKNYVDWEEYQQWQVLNGIVIKLENLIERVDRNGK